MADITVTFPEYTGGDIRRTPDQAEFDAAMNYFFEYHVDQFKPTVDEFGQQANALRDEVIGIRDATITIKNDTSIIKDDTLAIKNDTSIIKDETLAIKNEAEQQASLSLQYKNQSESAYNSTVTLLENTDISGTAGYTIEAIDDMLFDMKLGIPI